MGSDQGGLPLPVESGIAAAIEASPNPFLEGTTIRYSIPGQNVSSLAIFDVSGRLVRAFLPVGSDGGPVSVRWDGRDGSGRPVAAGLYFVRVMAGRSLLRRKVVKAN